MSFDIAVVGFGGAGTNIIAKIIENDNTTLYVVNDTVRLRDVIFYEYCERRELAKELLDYDWVIMTSGLGGRGGKSLVYVSNKLDNVLSIFVVFPSSVERLRISDAKMQLKLLKAKNRVFVEWLDDLLKIVPHLTLDLALGLLDRKIAINIMVLIKLLNNFGYSR